MIETNILGSAVGIQRQPVTDRTEGTTLPSLTNGVITGRFKRGRMDKAFTVTSTNYKAVLGYDPTNPSFLMVEDVFARGVSEIAIVRVGSSNGSVGVQNEVSYISLRLPTVDRLPEILA